MKQPFGAKLAESFMRLMLASREKEDAASLSMKRYPGTRFAAGSSAALDVCRSIGVPGLAPPCTKACQLHRMHLPPRRVWPSGQLGYGGTLRLPSLRSC